MMLDITHTKCKTNIVAFGFGSVHWYSTRNIDEVLFCIIGNWVVSNVCVTHWVQSISIQFSLRAIWVFQMTDILSTELFVRKCSAPALYIKFGVETCNLIALRISWKELKITESLFYDQWHFMHWNIVNSVNATQKYTTFPPKSSWI